MRSSPLRHPARAAGASLLRLQNDERLAELARDGHDAAFDAIVVRYRAALTRYCAGITGPDRADDAVQQTLINAHDALQKTDEVRHLRSWLYRIAHNVSLNVLRSVRDDVSLDDVRGASALVTHGPAEDYETSEQFRATVAALAALPERQRAALVLRELEGRSHEEIAEALGVTKGSARQHLMRARVAMRGAVTAITPYPLIARLADLAVSSGRGAGWSEAVTGAGVGATLTKLTAGVVATGALVGGAAVGTRQVVDDHDAGAAPAARAAEVRTAARGAAPGPARTAAPPVATAAEPIVATTSKTVRAAAVPRTSSSAATKARRHGSEREDHGSATAHDHGASTTSARGRGHGRGHAKNDRSASSPAPAVKKVEQNRGRVKAKVEAAPGRTKSKGSGEKGKHGESGKHRKHDAAPVTTALPSPTTTTDDPSASRKHGGAKSDDSGSGGSGDGD